MCGRYGLTIDQEALSVAYGVNVFRFRHEPRYNIAPSQEVPVLVEDGEERCLDGFRWGLVPSTAKDPRVGYRIINARSETIAVRPAFRSAWRDARRCLVLADGFYEWQAPRTGSGPKIPHWIHMADRRPFGFAGLWEHWDNGTGKPLLTCTVLTTPANELIEPIHDRMPAVLGDAEAWDAWVDPHVPSDELRSLLVPHPAGEMSACAVTTYVNHADHEGPACLEPAKGQGVAGEEPQLGLGF